MAPPSSPDHDAVAVVGMACCLPGAEDIHDFWELLCSGVSQHTEVPPARFAMKTPWRELDPTVKWYGNFIRDHDAFDHKFFRKSGREMASTDPQHRLMLQVAYQAVEQAGYFGRSIPDKHIACFIGAGQVDYEHNIACAPATAYTATGTLRSFVAGKISHYFGWTGPSLTVDTACSTSAVALHLACRALLNDECDAALTGGVNIMTSPEWFQNLAGASFLSPTGQCKPFDARADGYCRGEAVGAVFLKKLSRAVEDGDQVLGVIRGTAVWQNENSTAITVPNVSSLSSLFNHVVGRAGLQPQDISVAECHGTGTPVGDPIEYDAIRRTLGGSNRTDKLVVGSVKGLLGHTESASGITSLLKILVMIQEAAIPPQASYETANPALRGSASDNMEVARSSRPWDVEFRAALINNYGASGSNASFIVTQAPETVPRDRSNAPISSIPAVTYPFWLCGHDERSLRAYSVRLRKFIQARRNSPNALTIPDLAFQAAQQSNRSLGHMLAFGCSSIEELDAKLSAFDRGDMKARPRPPTRPVILTFGGQTSNVVGLDRELYDHATVLRRHLDICDAECRALGQESIFPDIFHHSPISNITKLQTMLFALQYSCAMSWIECGVEVQAVIGLSFGELTALCVSGVLTLQDALAMVIGRAHLIQEQWGTDSGAMMAVDANLMDVEMLLTKVSETYPDNPVSIACYNGPTSFTLAGSTAAIDAVGVVAAKLPAFTARKMEKLKVTNAFHSSLVDPLVPGLQNLGQNLTFREPRIPIELATEKATTTQFTAAYVADHMRNPVYFGRAAQRLSQRHGDCIWLEAGSSSTITSIAARTLGLPKGSHFQPINLTSHGALHSLAETTLALWRQGVDTSFWPHHRCQRSDYNLMLLPPYQFEKSRHWIDLKDPPVAASPVQLLSPEPPKTLWTFIGYRESDPRKPRFQVNTASQAFQDYVSGHVVALEAPLCPSTVQAKIVLDSLMSLPPASEHRDLQPQLHAMVSHAPLSIDPSRTVWLDAELSGGQALVWDWNMTSISIQGKTDTLHVSGKVSLYHSDDAQVRGDFARYERLVNRQRCLDLLGDQDPEEVITGPKIYKRFSEIVDYSPYYQHVRKIVSKGGESAGRVVGPNGSESWLDVSIFDSFCQIAGIYVNIMSDRAAEDIYISNKIDQRILSPSWRPDSSRPEAYEVFAMHHRPSDRDCVSDIFVFDPRDGKLIEIILGLQFQRVPKKALIKNIARFAPNASAESSAPIHKGMPKALPAGPPNEALRGVLNRSLGGLQVELLSQKPATPTRTASAGATRTGSGHTVAPTKQAVASRTADKTRELLANLSGVDIDQIEDGIDLADLGIDSLMSMELAREIKATFNITVAREELFNVTDVRALVALIEKVLGPQQGGETSEDSDLDTNNDSGYHSPQAQSQLTDTEEHLRCANGASVAEDRGWPAATVLDMFGQSKQAADRFLVEARLGGYCNTVVPRSNEHCAALIVDAFEDLECSLRSAKPGEVLNRVNYAPKHKQFVDWIYHFLEHDVRLIDVDGWKTTRTAIPVPKKSAKALLDDFIANYPDHAYDQRLTQLMGTKLADCLSGREEGVQVMFGDTVSRQLVANSYGVSPYNIAYIRQIEDYFKRLLPQLPVKNGATINILEIGSGTGGTSAIILPMLASLGLAVRYTITDVSPSLVAASRKRFAQYRFVNAAVFNIESAPATELLGQHIILGTNCVHATRSLERSLANIRQALRPDGFLMMLETTQPLPWLDLSYGLIEGWWLFEDGRTRAQAPIETWEKALHGAGYGGVDWTDGSLPESSLQRVILALASGERYERSKAQIAVKSGSTDLAARQAVVDAYVREHTHDFSAPTSSTTDHLFDSDAVVDAVLVTGATGSLGAHLVAHLASLPSVKVVVCLNRRSSTEAYSRQMQSFKTRGIALDGNARSKLRVLESDTSRPMLGLSQDDYHNLAGSVHHIVHNAWPMSLTRKVKDFSSQFKAMRNLIDFARKISCLRPSGFHIRFQFISSIATVGTHPLWTGSSRVPEERMSIDSVLPSGYGDAKLICERMLDQTLHQYPHHFSPMVVRIGQISGSTTSGYWNPVEHLPFVIKSSQTLRALPDLDRDLSWAPVDKVAEVLTDLLLAANTPYPVYHIENPVRQSWRQMIITLSRLLDIPHGRAIPFQDWVKRVRSFPGSAESDNPAAMLIDFLEEHFVRMDCGGLILDTTKCSEHSKTLRKLGFVDDELVGRYIRYWQASGILPPQTRADGN
ncbi:hypothetical protein LTR36_008399 [Oleoguttula mirabilis]|uniref:Polyketide synthase n=1 Tax=Oleoguttula mirabilis TaxID=1507867 RepID=A0AAV9J7X4_9PEZI|nr:hypothetical protein LTR36_008399 [Oleoguttula mirabilis]